MLPTTDSALHCYADDQTDWVIALSPEDASRAWTETTDEPHSDEEHGAWRRLDPDQLLSINLDDGKEPQRKPVREWIAECGRGWLCTENY